MFHQGERCLHASCSSAVWMGHMGLSVEHPQLCYRSYRPSFARGGVAAARGHEKRRAHSTGRAGKPVLVAARKSWRGPQAVPLPKKKYPANQDAANTLRVFPSLWGSGFWGLDDPHHPKPRVCLGRSADGRPRAISQERRLAQRSEAATRHRPFVVRLYRQHAVPPGWQVGFRVLGRDSCVLLPDSVCSI